MFIYVYSSMCAYSFTQHVVVLHSCRVQNRAQEPHRAMDEEDRSDYQHLAGVRTHNTQGQHQDPGIPN